MLKHLSIDEMVALAAPWVKNAKQSKLFLSVPEIAPLHPKVVLAYRSVLAVRPASTEKSDAMRALDEKLALVDDRHDHLAKAVSFGIDTHREHWARPVGGMISLISRRDVRVRDGMPESSRRTMVEFSFMSLERYASA